MLKVVASAASTPSPPIVLGQAFNPIEWVLAVTGILPENTGASAPTSLFSGMAVMGCGLSGVTHGGLTRSE